MSTNDIQLSSLRKELKDWEHNFINIQHRSPTKKDINANPSIQYKYKQYSKLKRNQSKKSSSNVTKMQNHTQRSHEIRSPIVKHDEKSTIIEIGPTPQIFGKSISIFELNLSPVKRRLQIPNKTNKLLEDDNLYNESTTKIDNDIFGMDFNNSPFVDEPVDIQPSSDTIIDTTTTSMEPEMGKLMVPILKNYGPNSPLKLPSDLSVQIQSHTPSIKRRIRSMQDNDSLKYTPPSLWKRNISKSLKDLEDEFIEASKTFVPMHTHNSEQQNDNDINGIEGSSTNSKNNDYNNDDKDIIPKGKRRKFRIRRFDDRFMKTDNSTTLKINLHKKMHKLKKKQLRKIMKDLNIEDQTILSESEDDSSEDEDENNVITSQKKKSSRKKKYNLVSNNFRRLKLPSKKRNNFTKRFHRR
ncbi:similar to Saccharomyces cerevisiae YKL108W SLD2 Single-stranded DNA origin-binding and annealing protein [Maudiozyma saulgeensis]|uniref:DNA replication regulator SLD2 n=1 Tax=Maudiozyma saulgeensis TaxID=1789683 RepID=A0A1X7R029_9SACH|nr:similar to Saccharomyces cerevisiae YKL108W SLD2 Single-stranded DNA origin-binding and annealing protein [Kazachstania saulgeensis]